MLKDDILIWFSYRNHKWKVQTCTLQSQATPKIQQGRFYWVGEKFKLDYTLSANTAHIKRSEIKVKLELWCSTQTVNQHIVKIKCFHMRMVIHHWLHDDLFLFWLQLCLASYHYLKEAWCGFRNLERWKLNKNIIFKRNTFMASSTLV